MTFVEKHNQLPTKFNDGRLLPDEPDSKKKFGLFACDSCDFVCTRPLKLWCFLSVFAIFVPVFVYYLAIDRATIPLRDKFTCLVKDSYKVSCGTNLTNDDCARISCCYDRNQRICYHFLPSKYGYEFDESEEEPKQYRSTHVYSPYKTLAISSMKISVNEVDADRVNIILHRPEVKVETSQVTKKNYNVTLLKDRLVVEVYRDNSRDLLLSTAKGPLIASQKYWEWTVQLTREYLFGLDGTLIDTRGNKTITKVIYKNKKDHSTLPTFWAYTNGKFHGLTIKHEGPLEITVLPGKLVVLRSISGGTIELQLSVGPTPKQLHEQQIRGKTVGLDHIWLLDTFVCRNSKQLDLIKIVQNYKSNLADAFCLDKNLLMSVLLTTDSTALKALNELLKELNRQNKKFLLSVPPYVPVGTALYDLAKGLDIVYKLNGKEYEGNILKKSVVYPDYSAANIGKYMQELENFIKTKIEIEVDGFVLHDNWPQNDGFVTKSDEFPYFPKDLQEALSGTIHWNASQSSAPHILTHNTYGSSQIEAFKKYYPNVSNKVILSASKSDNQMMIPNIVENVETSWENLQKGIDKVLFNSITGNHLVSMPVCGDTKSFDKVKQETLCLRWYLVTATMPLLRISSEDPEREPQDLYTVFGQTVAKRALKFHKIFKTYLIPFLTSAEPGVRPMFYDFYGNTATLSMKEQYMLGDKILVAHPMTLGREKLQVYLPERIGVWYELWDGEPYNTASNPFVSVAVTETDLVGFVAQGSIVPLQDGDSISLTIALNCTSDPCSAHGKLLLDNYVDIQADETKVQFSSSGGECFNLNRVKVYRYNRSQSKNIQLNGRICPKNGDTISIS